MFRMPCRKLDAEQIILYKQDWLNIVAEKRAEFELQYKKSFIDTSFEVKYATSIAEIYRENKQYSLLAMHYAICNNIELRDKYIEIALKEEKVTDQTICNLRILQGKPELIPKEIIQRELERMEKNKNWSQKARLQYGLGNYKEAVQEYIKSVLKSLENQNFFGAAFYLEELNNRSLVKKLFEMALQKATQEGNLWWQVRTLEHLERFDELKSLILRNAKEIEESGHSLLAIRLAEARNDNIDQKIEIHKEIARGIKVRIYGKEEQ